MPVHDKVADFLDDVIPNEIKPYLGTAAAAYAGPALGGLMGGGILQNFLGGAASDIIAQKLLYGSDEDRDTDYLSAGMSGILSGLQAADRGFLGNRDPMARTVDLTKPGVDKKFADRLDIGREIKLDDYMRNRSDLAGLADFNQAVIDAGGVLPANTNLGLASTGGANYFGSDFLKGVSDFATPFDFSGVQTSATPIKDIIGETTSSLGMLQLGQTPSQVRDAAKALKDAERAYQNYLDTLDAENRARIEDDINARIAAYKQHMTNAGFTQAEIDEALVVNGYLQEGETSFTEGETTALAKGGRVGFSEGTQPEEYELSGKKFEKKYNLFEDLFGMNRKAALLEYKTIIDEYGSIDPEIFYQKFPGYDLSEFNKYYDLMTAVNKRREELGETPLYARGGRVGFDMGGDTGGMTDRMGLGNYIEAEKVRTEFMDKMQRGLQAAEMNMKLNDPGLMRFVNALVPGGEGFYTREEMRFPSMKQRYEANIEKMKRDQARDDFEKRQLQKQLKKENFDMMVDMVDDRFSDNREQRKMANKGGRMTPQGDPISPDVPNGMQMDLRGGGFIPLGTKPKADDVPAMVGLNEFVLNDEAVSGIGKLITGKPDPRAGARALYQLQDQMEAIV